MFGKSTIHSAGAAAAIMAAALCAGQVQAAEPFSLTSTAFKDGTMLAV
jgi:hypothetical protein